MNRPTCLMGSLLEAKKWVEKNIDNSFEEYVLEDDILIDDIKSFHKFLNEPSLKTKVGIIYFFNKLNDSKQSIFLKTFENLCDDVKVIIHSSSFVNFTIQTRCNIHFLSSKEFSPDIKWLFKFFKNELETKGLTKEKMDGIKMYLETLNLFENGYLSTIEKDVVLTNLK